MCLIMFADYMQSFDNLNHVTNEPERRDSSPLVGQLNDGLISIMAAMQLCTVVCKALVSLGLISMAVLKNLLTA